jgi:hypothetical protein
MRCAHATLVPTKNEAGGAADGHKHAGLNLFELGEFGSISRKSNRFQSKLQRTLVRSGIVSLGMHKAEPSGHLRLLPFV